MHPTQTTPGPWPFPVVNGVASPVPAPAPVPPLPTPPPAPRHPVPLRSPTEEVRSYRPQPTEYQFLDEFTEDAPL